MAATLDAAPLAVGSTHALVLDGAGAVWSWGTNATGQLGTGMTTASTLPVAVSGLSGVVAVAAGANHSLALKSDGTVWSWGYNGNGQLGDGTTTQRTSPVLVPALTGIAAIAAGDNHSLALAADGTLWAWGANANGQLGDGTTTQRTSPVHLGLSSLTAIAAGSLHSVAVKSDGTGWGWGANASGQLGDGTTTQRTSAVQVSGLSGASAVAAGATHSLALKSDGTLRAWGANAYGQLGDGTATLRTTPVTVSSLTGASAVAAAGGHSLALRSDGSVWAWGLNTSGQLGDGTTTLRNLPVQTSGLALVATIAAGAQSSLALTSDQTLWAWGGNAGGQVGDGTTLMRLLPVKVCESGFAWKAGTPVLAPAPGSFGSNQTLTIACATTGATVRYTTDGSEPTPASASYASPLALTQTTTVKAYAAKAGVADSNQVAGAYVFTVATPSLSPATATYTTPQNATATTATSGATLRYTTDGSDPTSSSAVYTGAIPVATTTTLKVRGFKAGWSDSAVASAIYTMNFGTLAAPTPSPTAGTHVDPLTVTLTAASGATIRYTVDGSTPNTTSPVYTAPLSLAQSATLKALAFKADYTPSSVMSAAYTVQVAAPSFTPTGGTYPAGQLVTVATSTPGATLTYTLNGADPVASDAPVPASGVLLLGNFTLKVRAWKAGCAPSVVTAADYVITGPWTTGAIAAGAGHSLAIRPDGTLWAWGANNFGQLGDGTTTPRAVPVIDSLTAVRAVAAGGSHSLALRDGGSVWAWGSNANGQLGDGTTTQRNGPVQVTGLSGIVAVSAGGAHSLALKSDGTVFAWGLNSNGQLGDGSTTPRTTPVQVSGLTGIVAVAAGATHSLALKSDGTLVAWGANTGGQLGDGTTTQRTSPVAVGSLTSVGAIAAGGYHSLAVKSDGTAWAWGSNANGQLGDGTTTQRSSPVVVNALGNVSKVAAGAAHSLALLADGSVRAWGANGSGQLGEGTTTQRTAPVAVSNLAGVVAIAAGDYHGLALASDGSLWAWGRNTSSQLGDGTTTDRWTPTQVAEPGLAWRVGTPTFTPVPGTYAAAPAVALNSATPGSSIHYTTSGADPLESDSLYSTPIALSTSATLKAKAWKSGAPPSEVTTGVFTLKVGAPSLVPSTGAFNTPMDVTITTASPGATLNYTLTGVDPTPTDPVVALGGSVNVSMSSTLKARGFKSGWTPSDIASGVFTLKVGTPVLTPGTGSYSAAQTVTVTTATPGATLRYTLDGRDPGDFDAVIASGATVTVAGSTVLKVRGWRAGWTSSDVAVATYFVDLGALSTPTASVVPGSYAAPLALELACPQAASTLRYTLDGSDPNGRSPIYTRALSLDLDVTVKARCYAGHRTPSPTLSAAYVLTSSATATPRFNRAGSVSASAVSVTLSSATPGAQIRYTTNGVEPSVTDAWVASGGTVTLSKSAVLLARAFASGLAPSGVQRADFVITGAVAAGAAHTLALKPDGSVLSYGSNSNGQLGDGTTQNHTTPTSIAGLTGVRAIAAGRAHSLALKSDGTVVAWGSNATGQLGDGTTTQRLTPVGVSGLTAVTAIAAGDDHSLAVKADGSVWVWGANASGQLGDNSTSARPVPVRVGVTGNWLGGVVAVAAGSAHSLALVSDGTVAAWGANGSGQLGNGGAATSPLPVAVPGLKGVASIAAAGAASFALKTDGLALGDVWAWGANGAAQLGDGTSASRSSPVKTVAGEVALGAGAQHAFTLDGLGRPSGWGTNGAGQVGDGTLATRWRSVGLGVPWEPALLDGGGDHSVAVAADGSLWGWGANSYGQTGLSSAAVVPAAVGVSLADNTWLASDTDGDGLSALTESRLGSDPLDADTNRDGLPDGAALALGVSVTSADTDADGLSSARELQAGTRPLLADTDGDGVQDGADVFPLDPSRSTGTPNPADTTAPVITLLEPVGAVELP
jgi:alpha-tubulin suppressor-like RCC1 family protein